MEETRRGYRFEDSEKFCFTALPILRQAAEDVIYLLNHGYNIRSSVTFVGNHNLLSERQRLALARSLASDSQIKRRKAHELNATKLSRCVYIDGFNTIITLETALSGSLLLSCMDGTVRDLAGLHGTYRIIDKTQPAIRLIFRSLEQTDVKETVIYLDKQISNSGKLKTLILETAEEEQFPTTVELVPDVDELLKNADCVITSDSVVLDRCRAWYNLNRRIIKQHIPEAWLVRIP